MKRLLISAAVVGLFSAAPVFAQAGPSDSASAPANAIIVAPISVTNTNESSLSFGQIAADAAPGTVSVAANGALSSSTPNLVVDGSTGSAATFSVTGAANLAYSTNIPSPISLTGPGNAMSATVSKSGGSTNLSAVGADSFSVVGTLTVGAAQTPGAYSGTVNVTVVYD